MAGFLDASVSTPGQSGAREPRACEIAATAPPRIGSALRHNAQERASYPGRRGHPLPRRGQTMRFTSSA